jgi:alkanesulfonate monooxygenase SsuD/methylene tetrahydromethanopterin reductase-like flavin-dependent oxidoreductase (luciferase family)
VDVGVLLSDFPKSWGPKRQFEELLRQVEAAQRNGFRHLCLGQHFLYGDYTCLQPIPVFARLAAEVDPDVRLVSTIIMSPVYHPVQLAEDLATLDVMTEGRLVVGIGLGYRPEEFEYLGVPFGERVRRFEEGLELMKAIWTQPSVTFTGEFWQLDAAEPHITPWQQPYPPVWLGGHAPRAVRRAGRVADGWIIPPAVEIADVGPLLDIFRAEQVKRGLAPGLQPLRRNVFLGADRQDAMEQFMRASANRYLHYARNGHEQWRVEDIEKSFAEAVGAHVLAGAAADVLVEIQQIAGTLPVNPLILRAGWPDMDPDWFISYLDELGAELVPGIAEIEPLDLTAATAR